MDRRVVAPPIPVRTLLGSRGFETSLTCLRSLVRFSADPVRLVVHEDGTLTEEHRLQINDLSPQTEFIARADADKSLEELLAKYPHCLAFRRSEIMALKLFDICLLSSDQVAYCDSDVLFMGPYQSVFGSAENIQPVFMYDVGHAYAIRPWQLTPLGQLRLIGRLNAGVTLVPPSYLDLDFVEWLLKIIDAGEVFSRRRYWTEQTCWAALAARSGCKLFDGGQIVMATAAMRGIDEHVAAIHFVATHRRRLPEFAARMRPETALPIQVKTGPSRQIGPLQMVWSDMRRRLF